VAWQQEILEALAPPDPAQLNIAKARALRASHLPARVFKLRAVSKYSLDNFKNDQVWMSGADEFNDPYDSAYAVDTSLIVGATPAADLLALYDAFPGKTKLSPLSPAHRVRIEQSSSPLDELISIIVDGSATAASSAQKTLLKDALTGALTHVVATHGQKQLALVQKGLKVSCFTEIKDSVVMWAHYANYHKGFSVEYETAANSGSTFVQQLWPVIYGATRLDVTPHFQRAMRGEDFNNLVATVAALCKSTEWAYEREWRVVAPLGPSVAAFAMPTPKPCAVYLGTKIGAKDRDDVLQLARAKGVPAFQMRLVPRSFALTAEAIA
jgi:hypothetical protein